MSAAWYERGTCCSAARQDERQISTLSTVADDLHMLADLLGFDLSTLRILNGHHAFTWDAERVAEDREELEEYLHRCEPMPPAIDNRGRTIRRWLLSRESVRT